MEVCGQRNARRGSVALLLCVFFVVLVLIFAALHQSADPSSNDSGDNVKVGARVSKTDGAERVATHCTQAVSSSGTDALYSDSAKYLKSTARDLGGPMMQPINDSAAQEASSISSPPSTGVVVQDLTGIVQRPPATWQHHDRSFALLPSDPDRSARSDKLHRIGKREEGLRTYEGGARQPVPRTPSAIAGAGVGTSGRGGTFRLRGGTGAGVGGRIGETSGEDEAKAAEGPNDTQDLGLSARM